MWHLLKPDDLKFLLLVVIDLFLLFVLATVMLHVPFLDPFGQVMIGFLTSILIFMLTE